MKLKSQVFKTAHQIKGFFASWSEALKAAWIVTKLFFGRPVNFAFAKKDGELREAAGIAIGSVKTFEKGYVRFLETLQNGFTQWRSFRFERLVFL